MPLQRGPGLRWGAWRVAILRGRSRQWDPSSFALPSLRLAVSEPPFLSLLFLRRPAFLNSLSPLSSQAARFECGTKLEERTDASIVGTGEILATSHDCDGLVSGASMDTRSSPNGGEVSGSFRISEEAGAFDDAQSKLGKVFDGCSTMAIKSLDGTSSDSEIGPLKQIIDLQQEEINLLKSREAALKADVDGLKASIQEALENMHRLSLQSDSLVSLWCDLQSFFSSRHRINPLNGLDSFSSIYHDKGSMASSNAIKKKRCTELLKNNNNVVGPMGVGMVGKAKVETSVKAGPSSSVMYSNGRREEETKQMREKTRLSNELHCRPVSNEACNAMKDERSVSNIGSFLDSKKSVIESKYGNTNQHFDTNEFSDEREILATAKLTKEVNGNRFNRFPNAKELYDNAVVIPIVDALAEITGKELLESSQNSHIQEATTELELGMANQFVEEAVKQFSDATQNFIGQKAFEGEKADDNASKAKIKGFSATPIQKSVSEEVMKKFEEGLASIIIGDAPYVGSHEAVPPPASHPWSEWNTFLQFLDTHGFFQEEHQRATNGFSVFQDYACISRALRKFSQAFADILNFLPVKDLESIAKYGCPTDDRRVVSAGKRLRNYYSVNEESVCQSCNLQSSCQAAFVKPANVAPTLADVNRVLCKIVESGASNSFPKGPVPEGVKDSLLKLVKKEMDLVNAHKLTAHKLTVGSELSGSQKPAVVADVQSRVQIQEDESRVDVIEAVVTEGRSIGMHSCDMEGSKNVMTSEIAVVMDKPSNYEVVNLSEECSTRLLVQAEGKEHSEAVPMNSIFSELSYETADVANQDTGKSDSSGTGKESVMEGKCSLVQLIESSSSLSDESEMDLECSESTGISSNSSNSEKETSDTFFPRSSFDESEPSQLKDAASSSGLVDIGGKMPDYTSMKLGTHLCSSEESKPPSLSFWRKSKPGIIAEDGNESDGKSSNASGKLKLSDIVKKNLKAFSTPDRLKREEGKHEGGVNCRDDQDSFIDNRSPKKAGFSNLGHWEDRNPRKMFASDKPRDSRVEKRHTTSRKDSSSSNWDDDRRGGGGGGSNAYRKGNQFDSGRGRDRSYSRINNEGWEDGDLDERGGQNDYNRGGERRSRRSVSSGSFHRSFK